MATTGQLGHTGCDRPRPVHSVRAAESCHEHRVAGPQRAVRGGWTDARIAVGVGLPKGEPIAEPVTARRDVRHALSLFTFVCETAAGVTSTI